jgi:hypothetical protein
MRLIERSLVCSLLLMLVACGDRDSPEQRVRNVIADMELAAEARDVGDVTKRLSSDYRDAHGNTIEDVRRLLRGYFITNQSIHLLSRVEQISFPQQNEARAKVQIAIVGRDADAAQAWDLAADLQEFEIALIEEDGKWRVSWAQWRRN